MIRRTRFLFPSITLAAALLLAAPKTDDKPFQPGKAVNYSHQSSDQVTVGAKAFDNEDLTTEAFGKKADLLKYGILPVLVVIENKREKSLDLKDLQINLVAADGRHVSSIDPEEVAYLGTDGKRKPSQQKLPIPVPLPKRKNPMGAPEIVGRAFAAKMLPPGDSASGFFYFEAKAEAGDSVYLNGLRDARSGREIMYFEFPLDKEAAK